MNYRILIVDDEQTICHSLKEGLSDLGYLTEAASDGASALSLMIEFKPQIVLLDLRLGSENGIELIANLKNIDSEVVVMMMTAYGDVQTAVAAIKAGAFDYFNKPFDFDEIDILIRKGVAHLKTLNKLNLYEEEQMQRYHFMIGDHESLQTVHERISAVAQSERTTVLIQGETGTGKELVAAAIHAQSSRRFTPFVKINCGAIPEHLVESELFGFEKNAFTGANIRKKGLLEMADGGTVFLDEIAELSFDLQSKLLRFLEDQKFKRIGGLNDIEVDVQVLAATNRDLHEAIQARQFREDLFYRLNVFPILLPPLRQRGEDVILLAHYFAAIEAKKYSKKAPQFSEAVVTCFKRYRWPGNIRELKNIIERTMLLYQVPVIEVKHLPAEIAHLEASTQREKTSENGCLNNKVQKLTSGHFSMEQEMRLIEQSYIETAMKLSGNQFSKAAEILGISRFALKRKLEKK